MLSAGGKAAISPPPPLHPSLPAASLHSSNFPQVASCGGRDIGGAAARRGNEKETAIIALTGKRRAAAGLHSGGGLTWLDPSDDSGPSLTLRLSFHLSLSLSPSRETRPAAALKRGLRRAEMLAEVLSRCLLRKHAVTTTEATPLRSLSRRAKGPTRTNKRRAIILKRGLFSLLGHECFPWTKVLSRRSPAIKLHTSIKGGIQLLPPEATIVWRS